MSCTRCGIVHPPERDCKICGHRMDYIFSAEQGDLGNFRAYQEHAWSCPCCRHIEREPM